MATTDDIELGGEITIGGVGELDQNNNGAGKPIGEWTNPGGGISVAYKAFKHDGSEGTVVTQDDPNADNKTGSQQVKGGMGISGEAPDIENPNPGWEAEIGQGFGDFDGTSEVLRMDFRNDAGSDTINVTNATVQVTHFYENEGEVGQVQIFRDGLLLDTLTFGYDDLLDPETGQPLDNHLIVNSIENAPNPDVTASRAEFTLSGYVFDRLEFSSRNDGLTRAGAETRNDTSNFYIGELRVTPVVDPNSGAPTGDLPTADIEYRVKADKDSPATDDFSDPVPLRIVDDSLPIYQVVIVDAPAVIEPTSATDVKESVFTLQWRDEDGVDIGNSAVAPPGAPTVFTITLIDNTATFLSSNSTDPGDYGVPQGFNGSVVDASDFAATRSFTVTIPAGASSVQFAVPALFDDDIPGRELEPVENYFAQITGTANEAATVVVFDNRAQGTIGIGADNVETDFGSQIATSTISRTVFGTLFELGGEDIDDVEDADIEITSQDFRIGKTKEVIPDIGAWNPDANGGNGGAYDVFQITTDPVFGLLERTVIGLTDPVASQGTPQDPNTVMLADGLIRSADDGGYLKWSSNVNAFANDDVVYMRFDSTTEEAVRLGTLDPNAGPIPQLQAGAIFANGTEGAGGRPNDAYSSGFSTNSGFKVDSLSGVSEKMFVNFGTLINQAEIELDVFNEFVSFPATNDNLMSLVGQIDLYRDGKLIYSGTFGHDPDDILDTAIPPGFTRSDLIRPDIVVPRDNSEYDILLDGFEFDRIEISPLSFAHGATTHTDPGTGIIVGPQFWGREIAAIGGAVEFEYRAGKLKQEADPLTGQPLQDNFVEENYEWTNPGTVKIGQALQNTYTGFDYAANRVDAAIADAADVTEGGSLLFDVSLVSKGTAASLGDTAQAGADTIIRVGFELGGDITLSDFDDPATVEDELELAGWTSQTLDGVTLYYQDVVFSQLDVSNTTGTVFTHPTALAVPTFGDTLSEATETLRLSVLSVSNTAATVGGGGSFGSGNILDDGTVPSADDVVTSSLAVIEDPEGYPATISGTPVPDAVLHRALQFDTGTQLSQRASVVEDDDNNASPDLGGYKLNATEAITFRLTSVPVFDDNGTELEYGTLFKQENGRNDSSIVWEPATVGETFTELDILHWVLNADQVGTQPASKPDVTFTYVAVATDNAVAMDSEPGKVIIRTDLPEITVSDAVPESVPEGSAMTFTLSIDDPINGTYEDLSHDDVGTVIYVRVTLKDGLTASDFSQAGWSLVNGTTDTYETTAFIQPGQRSTTKTVTTNSDLFLNEGDENFELVIHRIENANGGFLGAGNSGIGMITEDTETTDVPGISLIDAEAVDEGEDMVFTITLSPPQGVAGYNNTATAFVPTEVDLRFSVPLNSTTELSVDDLDVDGLTGAGWNRQDANGSAVFTKTETLGLGLSSRDVSIPTIIDGATDDAEALTITIEAVRNSRGDFTIQKPSATGILNDVNPVSADAVAAVAEIAAENPAGFPVGTETVLLHRSFGFDASGLEAERSGVTNDDDTVGIPDLGGYLSGASPTDIGFRITSLPTLSDGTTASGTLYKQAAGSSAWTLVDTTDTFNEGDQLHWVLTDPSQLAATSLPSFTYVAVGDVNGTVIDSPPETVTIDAPVGSDPVLTLPDSSPPATTLAGLASNGNVNLDPTTILLFKEISIGESNSPVGSRIAALDGGTSSVEQLADIGGFAFGRAPDGLGYQIVTPPAAGSGTLYYGASSDGSDWRVVDTSTVLTNNEKLYWVATTADITKGSAITIGGTGDWNLAQENADGLPISVWQNPGGGITVDYKAFKQDGSPATVVTQDGVQGIGGGVNQVSTLVKGGMGIAGEFPGQIGDERWEAEINQGFGELDGTSEVLRMDFQNDSKTDSVLMTDAKVQISHFYDNEGEFGVVKIYRAGILLDELTFGYFGTGENPNPPAQPPDIVVNSLEASGVSIYGTPGRGEFELTGYIFDRLEFSSTNEGLANPQLAEISNDTSDYYIGELVATPLLKDGLPTSELPVGSFQYQVLADRNDVANSAKSVASDVQIGGIDRDIFQVRLSSDGVAAEPVAFDSPETESVFTLALTDDDGNQIFDSNLLPNGDTVLTIRLTAGSAQFSPDGDGENGDFGVPRTVAGDTRNIVDASEFTASNPVFRVTIPAGETSVKFAVPVLFDDDVNNGPDDNRAQEPTENFFVQIAGIENSEATVIPFDLRAEGLIGGGADSVVTGFDSRVRFGIPFSTDLDINSGIGTGSDLESDILDPLIEGSDPDIGAFDAVTGEAPDFIQLMTTPNWGRIVYVDDVFGFGNNDDVGSIRDLTVTTRGAAVQSEHDKWVWIPENSGNPGTLSPEESSIDFFNFRMTDGSVSAYETAVTGGQEARYAEFGVERIDLNGEVQTLSNADNFIKTEQRAEIFAVNFGTVVNNLDIGVDLSNTTTPINTFGDRILHISVGRVKLFLEGAVVLNQTFGYDPFVASPFSTPTAPPESLVIPDIISHTWAGTNFLRLQGVEFDRVEISADGFSDGAISVNRRPNSPNPEIEYSSFNIRSVAAIGGEITFDYRLGSLSDPNDATSELDFTGPGTVTIGQEIQGSFNGFDYGANRVEAEIQGGTPALEGENLEFTVSLTSQGTDENGAVALRDSAQAGSVDGTFVRVGFELGEDLTQSDFDDPQAVASTLEAAGWQSNTVGGITTYFQIVQFTAAMINASSGTTLTHPDVLVIPTFLDADAEATETLTLRILDTSNRIAEVNGTGGFATGVLQDNTVKPAVDAVEATVTAPGENPDGYPGDLSDVVLHRQFDVVTQSNLAQRGTVIGDDDTGNASLGAYQKDATEFQFAIESLPTYNDANGDAQPYGALYLQVDGRLNSNNTWNSTPLDIGDTFTADDRVHWVLNEDDIRPSEKPDAIFTYSATSDPNGTPVKSDSATVVINTDLPVIQLAGLNPNGITEGGDLSYTLSIIPPEDGTAFEDLPQSSAQTAVTLHVNLENGLTPSDIDLTGWFPIVNDQVYSRVFRFNANDPSDIAVTIPTIAEDPDILEGTQQLTLTIHDINNFFGNFEGESTAVTQDILDPAAPVSTPSVPVFSNSVVADPGVPDSPAVSLLEADTDGGIDFAALSNLPNATPTTGDTSSEGDLTSIGNLLETPDDVLDQAVGGGEQNPATGDQTGGAGDATQPAAVEGLNDDPDPDDGGGILPAE